MYLTHVKTAAVLAMRAALQNQGHPTLGDQDLWVGMEYPNSSAQYPGVWVSFTPNGAVQSAGIGHIEYRWEENGPIRSGTRWRFSGTFSFTVVALTIHQRDDLVDEILRLIAFGAEHPQTAVLREQVEGSEYLEVTAQWDKATISGLMESPGTPWGSNDLVCEGTVNIACQGSFVSDLTSQATLLPLSAIEIVEIATDMGGGAEFTQTDDQRWH